ncbi:hypothetical protein AB835_00410 [Candidatus Endobugula sertula]|uniref:J domain-containing protein n=1 Tax=Candidatus Endobugula sertula TaxID=62101 RepID=A0A1D2QTY8_9GAMM|nr:hypothetical protein AB835_00410 [Candidatus Endobugula sertula]
MLQLAIIVVIIIAFIVIQRIRRKSTEKRLATTIQYALYGFLICAIVLVITGKVHWITAAIAGILPLVKWLLTFVIRTLPFLQTFSQTRTYKQHACTQADTMDLDQALKIFGFDTLPNKMAIVQRHKELIQKNHPDRGGSDFLASQINEAKDILLKSLNK